ncbi:MAG: hypothetical protein ACYTBZ_26865 [Planctomycetota bacterium]|jgi:hypothetical protein
MLESIKNNTFILVFLSLALAGLIGFGMIAAVIGVRSYQERYIECDPKELLPILESDFDVNFPVDIKDVKAAKTPSIEGSAFFLVKFCAEPNTVGIILKSIEKRAHSVPYERKHTFTTGCIGWPSPSWARVPIKQGRKYTFRSAYKKIPASTDVDLLVDTTDKDSFVVYMEGAYLIRWGKQWLHKP